MHLPSIRRLANLAASTLMVIGSATTVSSTASSQERGITPTEIVIGAIGALTGPLSFIGTPGRDGMTLAFNEINARGGVCGRKLRLQFEHASTPAESLAAVKKLVEQDKVFILVLASGSTGAAAAADYVREVGMPTYNLVASTPIIREPFSKNVFHGAVIPVEFASQHLISMFYDDGHSPKKIGVLSGTYAYPQATLTAVEQVLKAKKLDYVVQQFDQSARDFTSQLVALSRQNVDSILVIGSFSEAGFAIKQAREMGMPTIRWVIDGTAVSRAIIPIIGNADGIRGYFNVPYFPGQNAQIREFESRLKTLLGSIPQGRPTNYDMIAYGSAYVMALAVEATDCQLSRSRLLEAWSTLKDAAPPKLGGLDVFFPESFTPTDHQGNYRLGATRVKNGEWEVYRVLERP
jgi:branched-chain amino acid transport system substrate-binding protein